MKDETEKLLSHPLPIIPMEEEILVTPLGEGLGALIGDIGSRSAQTVSDAINAEGNLVTDIINTKLDTSAKQILGDFTFGVSGALTMQTDADNGLWISPTGILAKKAGVNTLAITTGGDITLTGTITISNPEDIDGSTINNNSGWQTSGGVTTIIGNTITTGYVNALSVVAGSVAAENISGTTITGKTLQTASSGQRVVIDSSNDYIKFYDSNGALSGTIAGAPTYGIYANGDFYINGNLQGVGNSFATRFYANAGSGSGIEPTWNNSVTCGTSAKRWSNVYSVSGNFSGTINVTGAVVSNTSVLSPAFSAYGGGKANFTGNFTACPLPIAVGSALEKIGNPIPTPYEKLKDKTFAERDKDRKEMGVERMYYDIKQVPKECRFINSEKKDDIEISRTVGFLYQCVIELNEEIKLLKNK